LNHSPSLIIILVLSAFVVGCGDDPPLPPAPPVPDASGAPDADATPDAGPDANDASTDASPDGPVTDGRIIEGDGGGVETCRVETYDLAHDTITRSRSVAITSSADGFMAAWSQFDVLGDNLYGVQAGLRAPPGTPVTLTEEELAFRSPVIVNDLLVARVESTEHYTYDLATRVVGEFGSGTMTRLMDDAADQDQPVLVSREGGYLLLYRAAEAGTISIRSLRLDMSGRPVGAPQTVATLPGEIRSMDSSVMGGGVGLVYITATDSGGLVHFQRLTMDGAASGEARRLDTEGNASSTVSLAADGVAGLVAFDVLVDGVRPEVRMRLLDTGGAPTSGERIVTTGPERGVGPSVAAFSGGFVVVYRDAMPTATDGTAARATAAFVHGSTGDVVLRTELGDAHGEGGPIGTSVAPDGTLFALWTDLVRGSGTTIKAARLVCPDAWLRCSP